MVLLRLVFLLFLLKIISSKPCDDLVFCDDPPQDPDDDRCDDPVFCDDPPPESDDEVVLRQSEAQAECCDDPVFCSCVKNDDKECLTIEDINNAVFETDTRQAFNVCGGKCEDYAEHGFVCANTWNCRDNKIITDGKGLIDVRSATSVSSTEEENQCGLLSGTIDVSDKVCDGFDKICCQRPNFRIQKCPDNVKGKCDDPVFCSEVPEEELTNQPENSQKPRGYAECGRNASGSVLTITGNEGSLKNYDSRAQPGEFPHMCVIYREREGFNDYVGGASLIARNKVLTVAHKLYHKNGRDESRWVDLLDELDNIKVRCGEYNVKIENSFLPSQESGVVEALIHPDYDEKRIRYNLAILVTRENFVYQSHVGPVCLPRPEDNFDNDVNCWSSGWGKDGHEDGFYSDTLKKVDMRIVPQDECKNTFKNNGLSASRAHPSFLCVGGEPNKDTCDGDGGSPHVCFNQDNRYVLVGAVSHGKGCGSEVPASYSSVAGSMCWVDWVMSVVPLAKYDVDDREVEDDPLDLRRVGDNEYQSLNGLTEKECSEFKRNNGRTLTRELGGSVAFEIIDERSSG